MSATDHRGLSRQRDRVPGLRARLFTLEPALRRAHLNRVRVDGQARVFATCLLVLAANLTADALAGSSTSNELARKPLWLGIALMPLLLLFFARAGAGARTALAAAVGLVATCLGLLTSLPHAVLAGASGSDYTGFLATLAGLLLLGLAFRIGLAGRRLATKLIVAVAACFVLLQWIVAPAINAGSISNATHPTIARADSLGLAGARDVTFPSADGVRLSGWYVPGRNGAAVILLHGSHGTRADTLSHLRLLAAQGYAVLAYDARGHGESAGTANALGWHGVQDVAAAVRFLSSQPGIEAGRIAALGLSMGAEESLRAAAGGVHLAAVVADGAGASTLADNRIVAHALGPVFVSVTWLTMRAAELSTGDHEPAPLKDVVGRIDVPVLMIASNAQDERAIDAAYLQRIGHASKLWYVPDAVHAEALSAHPRQYATRVAAFLSAALAAR